MFSPPAGRPLGRGTAYGYNFGKFFVYNLYGYFTCACWGVLFRPCLWYWTYVVTTAYGYNFGRFFVYNLYGYFNSLVLATRLLASSSASGCTRRVQDFGLVYLWCLRLLRVRGVGAC